VVDAAVTTDPIFIIGTERSGSNLLRLMLNAHSRIAIPHPPHFMRFFAPIADSYGDLAVEANRQAIVADHLVLLRRHIHPWLQPIDGSRAVTEAAPTVFGVMAACYEQYRRAVGKARWGCKSTFMVHYVDDALAQYPDARFVWLVRDPRDVASSAKRSVFGYSHPYRMAKLWQEQQELGCRARDGYGPDAVYLLRYEGLVLAPAAELATLCAFLGEKVEPDMLHHQQLAEARRTAELSESWRSTGEPVSTRFIDQHRDGLTERERRQVDSVTRYMTERLGYRTGDVGARVEPGAVELLVGSLCYRAAIEFRSTRRDRNYLQRVARDATVRWMQCKARLRSILSRWRP
jgi:hypothetical protein